MSSRPSQPAPAGSLDRPGPASARAFGATLPERSEEIEALRRLPDDVVEAMVDLGLFRMFVPTCYGGHQLELREGFDVLEELSYWDGAVGWCAMIGATTALLAGFLPPEHARAIYADDPRAVTGGVAEPRGRARLVDGGLVASGRWAWGSGTHHCQWIGGGCLLAGEGEERSRPVFVFFARDQVKLLDTWHVAGLRGTGSGDFEVEEAFVPEGRWVELAVDAARVDDPLYAFPQFGALALGVAAVGLGLARRAIDELVALAREKRYVGSRRTLAERPSVQAEVAAAQARLLAARAFVVTAVDEAWRLASGDGPGARGRLEVEPRRRIRLATTHAMRSAVEVVDAMHEVAGGTAVYDTSPLGRLLRDVHVAAAHGMVARRTYELTGRLALGLETDVRQL